MADKMPDNLGRELGKAKRVVLPAMRFCILPPTCYATMMLRR